jgi:hypothetical protein
MSKKYMTFFTQVEDNTTPWYLAGGVYAANCVAAYQAKGAADYATSKVNLANPGTHDLTDGVAPAFSDATGWTFDGVTNYLTGDYGGEKTGGSFIIDYTHGIYTNSSEYLFAAQGASHDRIIFMDNSTGYIVINNFNLGNMFDQLLTPAGGIICASGINYYLNATNVFVDESNTPAPEFPSLYIGCHMGAVIVELFCSAVVRSIAMYDIALSEAQVTSITSAMLLL